MGSTSSIVRWEILKGLPAEGPEPKYFHEGHPTPWAEGFVVKFWNEDGTEWVGNFQSQWGVRAVFDLPTSTVLVVIACGACYFVPKSEPNRYTFGGRAVSSTIVDEERNHLVLAHCGGNLAAYAPDGSSVWVREGLAVDGIDIRSIANGVITADVEFDYDGSRRTVRLNSMNGNDW